MEIDFKEIETHLNDSKNSKIETTVNGVCKKCNKPFTVNFYNIFRKKDFSEICHKCKLSKAKAIERWDTIQITNQTDIENVIKRINECENPTAWKTTCVIFNCIECGKEKSIQLKSFIKDKSIICPSCKCIHTNQKLYGYKTSFSNENVQIKAQKSQIDKYGGIGLAAQDIKEKARNTNLVKYGAENPLSKGTTAYIKRNKTVKDVYGVDNVFQNKNVKEQIAKTNLEKYGVQNPSSSDDIKAKIVKTNLSKYGVESFTQTTDFAKYHKSSYVYDGIKFDSSWELIFYIYQVDHNNKIIRNDKKLEYEYNGKKHFYFPDFNVNGKLYEIKGDHFWKEDGTMQNPFDHSMDGLFEAKHQCGLKNNVTFIKKIEIIEMENYIIEKYTNDYLKLFKENIDFPFINSDFTDKSDMGVIRHFHKSIYYATKKGKISPFDAWKDKTLVKKAALNRIKYVGRCKPQDIVQGFTIAWIAPKISVFKPTLAKRLIQKYLDDYSEIFDPFSGFSGRLIGAQNCNKRYIGQDLNIDHVLESNEIIKHKNYSNATCTLQDILTDVPHTYECLFTCPPYGGKEHWNENNDEVEKSCDEWIDICLEKYKCKKYLFVVDKTEKYKKNIVEVITNKSHFGVNQEFVVLI